VSQDAVMVVNGWTILVHPLFLQQVGRFGVELEKARAKNPETYLKKNAAKRLAAIMDLAFDKIPQNPAASIYLQGNSLGDDYKHWFRAKFFQQYRLFFRYDTSSKIIIYGWVNDDSTKRAYGSKTDAYAVFRGMLNAGHPPDDWNDLKRESDAEAQKRAEDGKPTVGEAMAGVHRLLGEND